MKLYINKRKLELMKKDPEVHDFEKKLKELWNTSQQGATLLEQLSFFHDADRLKKGIEEKWKVEVYILKDGCWTIFNEYFDIIHESVSDGRENALLMDLTFEKHPTEDKVVKSIYDRGNKLLFYQHSEEIPIIINTAILTMNDARKVKKAVWEIIEPELRKKRRKTQRHKGWNPSVPKSEPKELGFLYRSRDNTFEKYLRWYDWAENNLPFRLIRILENNPPDKREKYAEKVISKERKPKIGHPIPGERGVKHGVKLVHEAIHRKPFSSSANTLAPLGNQISKYDCLSHGNDCPRDCKYLRTWLKKHFRDDKPLREVLFTDLVKKHVSDGKPLGEVLKDQESFEMPSGLHKGRKPRLKPEY